MTENYEAAIRYLKGLALSEAMAHKAMILGTTTLAEIEGRYAFLDRIGDSYSGGPVVGLAEWEINIDGIAGIELAFNAAHRLDVAVVRVCGLEVDEILEAVGSAADEAEAGAKSVQVNVDADATSDGGVLVTFSSEAFLRMKDCYKVA